MGHFGLNGWDIYHLMDRKFIVGWAFRANGWGIYSLNGWEIYRGLGIYVGLNRWDIHGLNGWGSYGLNERGIYHLMGRKFIVCWAFRLKGWGSYGKVSFCFVWKYGQAVGFQGSSFFSHRMTTISVFKRW